MIKDDEDDVPMDLKSEFITSLLAKNYSDSLKLCKIILRFSPDHELAKEYLPVLEEMITLQHRKCLYNCNARYSMATFLMNFVMKNSKF